ncbi:MAG: hypothetical protein R6V35_01740 [Candidatus Nanohaloarchaea archaeon]
MAERGIIVKTNEDGSLSYWSHKYGATGIKEIIADIYDAGEITDNDLPTKKLEDLEIDQGDIKTFDDEEEFITQLDYGPHYEAIWIEGSLYRKLGEEFLLVKPDDMRDLMKIIGLSNVLFHLEKDDMLEKDLEEIFRVVEAPSFLESDNLEPQDIYDYVRGNFETFN